jgi:hypothetical protein
VKGGHQSQLLWRVSLRHERKGQDREQRHLVGPVVDRPSSYWIWSVEVTRRLTDARVVSSTGVSLEVTAIKGRHVVLNVTWYFVVGGEITHRLSVLTHVTRCILQL